MDAPSPTRWRDRVLNDAEIRRLWHVLPTALPRQIDCQRVLRLCLLTGQRVGEVAGMRRDELDLNTRTWALAGVRTKNGHPHSVPLSDPAVGIIEQALADAGDRPCLFALPPVAVARFVERAQAKFGIMPAWVAHDLRRTALTQMAALGVEPVVLGHVANHRTTTRAGVTLSVYVKHSYDAEKRRGADPLGRSARRDRWRHGRGCRADAGQACVMAGPETADWLARIARELEPLQRSWQRLQRGIEQFSKACVAAREAWRPLLRRGGSS